MYSPLDTVACSSTEPNMPVNACDSLDGNNDGPTSGRTASGIALCCVDPGKPPWLLGGHTPGTVCWADDAAQGSWCQSLHGSGVFRLCTAGCDDALGVVGTSFSTGPSLVMKCNDADPISPSLAVTLCADTNPDMLGGLCLLVDGGYGNWDICDDDMAAGWMLPRWFGLWGQRALRWNCELQMEHLRTWPSRPLGLMRLPNPLPLDFPPYHDLWRMHFVARWTKCQNMHAFLYLCPFSSEHASMLEQVCLCGGATCVLPQHTAKTTIRLLLAVSCLEDLLLVDCLVHYHSRLLSLCHWLLLLRGLHSMPNLHVMN